MVNKGRLALCRLLNRTTSRPVQSLLEKKSQGRKALCRIEGIDIKVLLCIW